MPELRQDYSMRKPEIARALVADTVALVKKKFATTPDSYGSSRDNRTPDRRTPDVLDQEDDSDDEFDSD